MQNDRIRWWPLHRDEHECVGKVQLYICGAVTCDESSQMKVQFV